MVPVVALSSRRDRLDERTRSARFTANHQKRRCGPTIPAGWAGTRLGRENYAYVALQDPTPKRSVLGVRRPLVCQLLVFVLKPARDEAPGVAQLGPHMIGIRFMHPQQKDRCWYKGLFDGEEVCAWSPLKPAHV